MVVPEMNMCSIRSEKKIYFVRTIYVPRDMGGGRLGHGKKLGDGG